MAWRQVPPAGLPGEALQTDTVVLQVSVSFNVKELPHPTEQNH